jgi:Zn ribbon nucleic-acid-binding protein
MKKTIKGVTLTINKNTITCECRDGHKVTYPLNSFYPNGDHHILDAVWYFLPKDNIQRLTSYKIAEEWLNAQLKQMGNSFSQTQPTFKPATNYPNRYIANKNCPECGNNAYKYCPPYPTQTTEYYECMGCGHVVMVSPNSSH